MQMKNHVQDQMTKFFYENVYMKMIINIKNSK